ncbi:MAG: hypothetical protein ACI4QJ_02965 [Candidatus Spyradenecus sp.]
MARQGKMTQQERVAFFSTLATATDERAVQRGYEQGILLFFPRGTVFDYPCKCDGYLNAGDFFFRLLCEYKLDEALAQPLQRAKVLVQVVYYLKLFEEAGIEMPTVLFVGDKNECFVLHSNPLLPYLDWANDWSLAPSAAWHSAPEMVAHIAEHCAPEVFVYTVEERRFELGEVVAKMHELATGRRRHVRATPANVSQIFDYFCQKVLREPTLSPNDLVGCFFAAILNSEDTYLHPKKPGILVYGEREVHIDSRGWQSYFEHYDNTYTPCERAAFTAIYDRLLEDVKRRRNGEFYTPTPFVNLAHRLIAEELGEDWRERFVVWDCAWGTGNLTRDFRFTRLYASTNEAAELNLGQTYNPEATKFRFDFLNDPIDDLFAALPTPLLDDLKANKPLLFFINPPYATAQDHRYGHHRAGATFSATATEMRQAGVGSSAQQLFAQFLYRICQIKERFHLTQCHLALFCNPVYLSGYSHRKFRQLFLRCFYYRKGVLFNAGHFADVKSTWGIHFSLWMPTGEAEAHLFPHTLLDVEGGRVVVIGSKTIYNVDAEKTGNDWCKEPVAKLKTEDAPQLTNAIRWDQSGAGRLIPRALGYYVMQGNNVDNNPMGVILFSGTSKKGHGTSVLPENFLRVCAMFTARKLINKDWTNAKDEYCVPDTAHPDYASFEADSVLFALFHPSGQQSSLGQVDYKGKSWEIRNEWFWVEREAVEAAADRAGLVETWQAVRTDCERFVAAHLAEWSAHFSPEGREVLRLAREIAIASYAYRARFAAERPELQLLRWDAGWYQIKPLAQLLLPKHYAEFQAAFKALSNRLRPLVYTLGFLR